MNFNSTEHPLTWFRDRYRDGELDIRPPYQRQPVWADRQRNALIESVLLQLPIPEVYIHQVIDGDGETTHAVVDGQQRIRTILQFIGAETEEGEEDSFTLDLLEPDSDWYGLGFEDLSAADRKRFWHYRLSVRVLESDSEDEIRDMFRRLNRYTVPLSPQELRNATYVGPFAQLAIRIADENDFWATNRIVSAQSIRRMGDIEFVAELLIGVLHGPQGGGPATIDDYYRQYEDYEDQFPRQQITRQRFNRTLALVEELLPKVRQMRWSNKTDFYTLFVALAYLDRAGRPTATQKKRLARALSDFVEEVEALQADEEAAASEEARRYLHALSRGANDKSRRGERHQALLAYLDPSAPT